MPSLNELRQTFFGSNRKVNGVPEYDILNDLVNQGAAGINHLQQAQQVLINQKVSQESAAVLEVGQGTLSRRSLTFNGVTLASGVLRLTAFTGAKNFTASKLRLICAGAAGATPTLVRAGIYSIDPETEDMTLVASIANDTALFNVANTEYERNLTAPVDIVQGVRYAVGLLCVTGATAPNMVGIGDAHTASAGINKRHPFHGCYFGCPS